MIQEAIDRVKELAVQAQSVQVLDIKGEKPGIVHLYDRRSGARSTVVTTVAGREYKAESLPQLAEMVKYFIGQNVAVAPVVLIGCASVRVILDESERREESIELALSPSEPYRALQVVGEKSFSQRDFLWLLRTTFNGCDLSDLTAQVRTVKFNSDSQGEVALKPGRESISSSVLAEMRTEAAKDFPEEVEFSIPVFRQLVDDENQSSDEDVRCALNIRVDKQEFSMRPLPGELERALASTQSWIAAVLKRLLGDVPVFIGYGK